MEKMRNIISKFLKKGSKGTTAIEYALLASLIAVVAIATMRMVGSSITDNFQQVAETINGDGPIPGGLIPGGGSGDEDDEENSGIGH